MEPMSSRNLGLLVCATVVSLGCGTTGRELRGGITRYEVGHFNAAARHCGELDGLEDELNDKAHVRYLVYCGLTQYKLGNREDARELLTVGAAEYEQGRDGWLKPLIVNELYEALDDLAGADRPRPYTKQRQARPASFEQGSALRSATP
jgi:hypothetical protein